MGIYVGITALNRSSSLRLPIVSEVDTPVDLEASASAGSTDLAADDYFYVVTALGTEGESSPGNEVEVEVTEGDEVALTWDAVTGATGYRVYRGTATEDYDGYYEAATNEFTDEGATLDGETAPPTEGTSITGSVQTELVPGEVYIVDVDNSLVRRELARHSAISQWKVVALNDTYRAADGSLDTLPAND
jgi:hypothetical protein